MVKHEKRKALVIGGQFTGIFSARDLKKHFDVTVVDCKEYFEYTPGILRCFVKPAHFDSLAFTLQPVLERSMGVKFVWGEVTKLDGIEKTATVVPIYSKDGKAETIRFDYCICCSGCNFGPFQPMGESHWFPTVHAKGREVSQWQHVDERFFEGRRRHILEEYHKLHDLNEAKAKILVVGAGFIGVEWATEIEHYFPNIGLTIIDMLPNCLGPLPASAAEYCSEYMHAAGIKEFYGLGYDPKNQEFWDKIELPKRDVTTFVCIGVKASNYFIPEDMLSVKGPGGGKWIHVNEYLQVTERPPPGENLGNVWGDGVVFAVGDCNYGCIGNPPNWVLPPIPKISYPGEEQALHACNNMITMDEMKHGGCLCKPKGLQKTWWPWGAGMFATSLGPHDACFVVAANENKGSGYMVNWWYFAAIQKEFIETTKVDECKNHLIGKMIWHFVHHTPIHLWGRGAFYHRR